MVEINDAYSAMQYKVSEYGVYVVKVEDGSAADKAGMEIGDRLVSIGSREITTSSDVGAALSVYKAGDTAEVKVSRDSKEITLNVVFDEYSPETK